MLELLRRRRAAGSPLRIGPDLVGDILTLIRTGWTNCQAYPDVNSRTPEVNLNARLRQGMCEAVNARVVRAAKRISVLPGTESGSSPGHVPEGRTDISIHLRDIRERYDEHGPHAVIECKRVEGADTDLCRLYVVEGMHRFGSRKYGAGYAIGFMAGYLVSGSAADAAAGINKYLRGKGRASEALVRSASREDTWTSTQPRRSEEGNILLHHSMLPFSSTAVRQP